MRVSEVFTMASGDVGRDHNGESSRYQNYYYDYENEGYYNNVYGGFERGPTRPSLLALIG